MVNIQTYTLYRLLYSIVLKYSDYCTVQYCTDINIQSIVRYVTVHKYEDTATV